MVTKKSSQRNNLRALAREKNYELFAKFSMSAKLSVQVGRFVPKKKKFPVRKPTKTSVKRMPKYTLNLKWLPLKDITGTGELHSVVQ
jgi:hypothetical protein